MTAAVLAVACAAAAAPAAAADRLADRGFFGVQGWRQPTGAELRSLERGGIGSLRAGFNRAAVVGRRGARYWDELDAVVAGTARAGIELLPVLSNAPWVRGKHRPRPPLSRTNRRAWESWVEEVVGRYGYAGSFWFERTDVPYRPVSAWQVWNEPNLRAHWPHPSARRYVDLLRTTARAIRATDPAATIVLGGVPDTRRGVRVRPYLQALYRQPGFTELFDVMALHPYARDVVGVEEVVEQVRSIMRRHGDRDREIWITEIGWATGGPTSSRFRVSATAQAERLRDAYDMFIAERRRWRLTRVFWFSLRDRDLNTAEQNWFGPHTGLFYRSGYAKPAWEELTQLTGGRADQWLGGAPIF
jgi:hypothetical protein